MDRKQAIRKWLWYFSIPAAAVLLYKIYDNFGEAMGLIGKLIGILSPFVGGFILAFFLHGPCRWLEGKLTGLKGKAWPRLARPLSLVTVYLALLGVLALVTYLVVPVLTSSLTDLVGALPRYLTTAQKGLEEFMGSHGALADLQLEEKLAGVYQSLLAALTKLLTTENILTALRGVGSVASSLIDVVIAFVVSVYMLAGQEHLSRALNNFLGLFINPPVLSTIRHYTLRSGTIFQKYFYGALLDALAVGVIVSIGLLIFRVPYAVLLGMMLGLMNMIPYFGAIIGCIGIALITLLTSNLYTAIGVIIYVVVVQQIDANIIQPRVVGDSVGLRPFYVLLSITLFGGLFGFWGIFLAPPLMAIIQMFVRDASANKCKQAVPTPTESEE